MELNGNGNGNHPDSGAVTYAEVRRMAYWLNAFTARELAEALRVHEAVGERFVKALRWAGHVGGPIIDDTGVQLDGPQGPEQLFEVVPLPIQRWPRIKRAPPWITAVLETGGFLLYDARGEAVRIRTERRQRGPMSTPGSRQKHINAERAYRRQEEAKRKRAEQSEKKRIAQSQGKQYVPSN